ncbi:MAG TPA: hypothetical protein VGB55_13280 [Tepidisphaeraceae bacterium]
MATDCQGADLEIHSALLNSSCTVSARAAYGTLGVGDFFDGVVNHAAQTLTVDELLMSRLPSNNPTVNYNLSGTGAIVAQHEVIGTNYADFYQCGGTNTVSDRIFIGGQGNQRSHYFMGGGTVALAEQGLVGVYNLSVGTLTTGQVESDRRSTTGGNTSFHFDDGTLAASASNETFFLLVGEGGCGRHAWLRHQDRRVSEGRQCVRRYKKARRRDVHPRRRQHVRRPDRSGRGRAKSGQA